MSQYGRVHPNYYNPVAKFNTIRLSYKYANFNAFQGVIDGFCFFNVIYDLIIGSLNPIATDGYCISSAPTKHNAGTFTFNLTGINSCTLDYIQPANIITRVTNFINGNVNKSCSINVNNTPIAPLTPTGQTTIDGWCLTDVQYLTSTGSLNPINIDGNCIQPAPIKYNTGDFVPNITGVNSCTLDYIQPSNIITRVELSSRIVNVNGSCELNII